MEDKRKYQVDEDEELIDIEKEYGIKESDLMRLNQTHEKGKVKILKHKLKKIDDAIEQIDDGLSSILYLMEELIEDYEDGKIFGNEGGEAIDKLFILMEFTHSMEEEFKKLKDSKKSL